MNPSNPLTMRRIESIKAATTFKALSAHELASSVHVCHQSALQYIRYLLGDDPETGWQMYIERWREIPGYGHVAVYRWGARPNAPKPARMTGAEVQREYMQRLKKDPIRYELFRARERGRDRANRATKKPQSWASALFAVAKKGGNHVGA